MVFSILAETGRVDKVVHTLLVTKILKDLVELDKKEAFDIVGLDAFNPNGKNDLFSFLHTAINLLSEKYEGLDVVVVIVDGDKLNRNEQITQIKRLLSSKEMSFPTERIVIGIPVRNIEAWLLSDTKTINEVTGMKVAKAYTKPEIIKDPKIEMKQIYGTYRKNFDETTSEALTYPEFLENISRNLSVIELAKRSPSFNWLAKDLRTVVNMIISSKRRFCKKRLFKSIKRHTKHRMKSYNS